MCEMRVSVTDRYVRIRFFQRTCHIKNITKNQTKLPNRLTGPCYSRMATKGTIFKVNVSFSLSLYVDLSLMHQCETDGCWKRMTST